MRAARVAVSGRPWATSCWRIIHLGRKPVKGGSPAMERRTRGNIMVTRGALVEAVASALMVVEEVNFKVRKAAVVIKRYIAKASIVREGAN